VFTLEALSDEDVGQLVDRAIADGERGLAGYSPMLAADARGYLVNMANGDARTALNALEAAVLAKPPSIGDKRLITLEDIRDALQGRATRYDKNGELHYDAISALHKSVRDSDPDAALYWLGRMLDGGEDALYIARRVVRMAVEDIGMADPQALAQTMAAQQAVHFLGQPEGDLALAQAVVYLCQAPKSNAVYKAYGAMMKDVAETRNEPVPLHLRNAPTRLMKGMGFGKGYQYAHDLAEGRSDQAHLPPNLEGRIYYEPTDHGFESLVRERLAWREARGRQAAGGRRQEAGGRRQEAEPPAEIAPGEEPQLSPDDFPPPDDEGAPPPTPRPRGRPRKGS
jgi:putative ATPase